MGWKNWPSWLKGGIIFGFIPIIITSLIYIFSDMLAILILMFIFGFGIPTILDDLGFTANIFSIIGIPIIIWFIIGSVIGYIAGKIKGGKKK